MANAIILAGGFGTRLRPSVSDKPKPLAPVQGRPFLDHQLAWAAMAGIDRVILTVHHMADQLIEFAAARDGRPLPIDVVHEETPLGTGGAVKNAIKEAAVSEDVVVMNGDTYYNFALRPVLDSHGANPCPVTMAVAQVDDCARYGTVRTAGKRVTGFDQATGRAEPGLVNCGLYVFDCLAMEDFPQGAFSMEHDFFPAMAERSLIAAFAVAERPAFIDIGTPESYAAINENLIGT